MKTITVSAAQLASEFISFLKNGNFTLMRICKGKISGEEEIILCYGASGDRAREWGDTLLSVKISHADLKGSGVEYSQSIQSFFIKENVSYVWASCPNKTFYLFPLIEKIEISESDGIVPVVWDEKLKIAFDEALDVLLLKALERNYFVAA